MAEQQSYRAIWSELLRHRVQHLGEQTIQSGRHREFLNAMRAISEALACKPLTWGDPLYQLRSTDLLICHRLAPPIHIFYGVDESRRLVYVKDLLLTCC